MGSQRLCCHACLSQPAERCDGPRIFTVAAGAGSAEATVGLVSPPTRVVVTSYMGEVSDVAHVEFGPRSAGRRALRNAGNSSEKLDALRKAIFFA